MVMSTDPGATSRRDDAPHVNRLLTLSDGVVAIALTLLVLQLRVPALDQVADPDSAADLAAQLGKGSAQLVSYGIAFYVIAQFWLVHRHVFRLARDQEDGLEWWNFAFLFTITIMPFTSTLLGAFVRNPLAVDIFALNLLLASLATQAMIIVGRRKGLLISERQGASRADKRGGRTGRHGPVHRTVMVEHRRRHVLLDPDGRGTRDHQPVVSPQLPPLTRKTSPGLHARPAPRPHRRLSGAANTHVGYTSQATGHNRMRQHANSTNHTSSKSAATPHRRPVLRR